MWQIIPWAGRRPAQQPTAEEALRRARAHQRAEHLAALRRILEQANRS